MRSVPIEYQHSGSRFDFGATLVSGLIRQGSEFSIRRLEKQDLRQKVFRKKHKSLIVFVVDASDSMGQGTIERMKAAKGAILGWLLTAYQQRDQVALVAFRGQQADILLPPTASVFLAQQRLRQLAVGGATPLADGLYRAGQLVRIARQKQPLLVPLVVVVSDGEANVPMVPGADVESELYSLARILSKEQLQTMIVDSSTGVRGSALLRNLAKELDGQYQHVRDLNSGQLFDMIRSEGIVQKK